MKLLSFLLFILSLNLISCSGKDEANDRTVYGILEYKVKGLDPIMASDKYSSRVLSQIYEGLYGYHYLKRPLELVPQIAEALPEVSQDGLSYTIKLKKGLFFQNDPVFKNSKGREIIADDVIYSWKRLADPNNSSPGFWVFDGRIQGLNQWREKVKKGQADYKTPIKGLSASDRYTLQITLNKKFPQFLHLLAMTFTKIVPREAVEVYGKDFINKPVGSGPFRLKKWTRGSQIRLVRNEHYREDFYPSEGTELDKSLGRLQDAGKKLPLADEVVIKIMPEQQSIWLNFKKGNIDFSIIPKDNFTEILPQGKLSPDLAKKGIRIHGEPRADVTYFAFNMDDPLFGKNKKLRQAMAMAYDSQTCRKKFFNDTGIVAQSVIPPHIDGYEEGFYSPVAYNLEKAKSLLAEAGYPNGKGLPEIRYELASAASVSRQMGEFMKEEMAKIGIKMRLVTNTWPQFEKKVKSRKAMMFGMAWSADYPDGENFLQIFYSKNSSPGSNASNFSNLEYDNLYLKASSMPPTPQRTELYKKMNRMIAEETPAFFNMHRAQNQPYHGWLKNYKEHTIIHDFYKYLRVDAKKTLST